MVRHIEKGAKKKKKVPSVQIISMSEDLPGKLLYPGQQTPQSERSPKRSTVLGTIGKGPA